jgi:hypothetical protein
MNWVAWGLSGILFLVMVNDFIRVERGREGGGKP